MGTTMDPETFAKTIQDTIKNWIDTNKQKGQIDVNDFQSFLDNDLQLVEKIKKVTLKKNRIKIVIPMIERCQAYRAPDPNTGELIQCTRRRKDDTVCFCGTHKDKRPHGEITNDSISQSTKKVEIWQQDIQGIIYHIDANHNVYHPNDIVSCKLNPRIIGKYQYNTETNSGLPE